MAELFSKPTKNLPHIDELAPFHYSYLKPHWFASDFVLLDRNSGTISARLKINHMKGTGEASFDKDQLLFASRSFWGLNYDLTMTSAKGKNEYKYNQEWAGKRGRIKFGDAFYEWERSAGWLTRRWSWYDQDMREVIHAKGNWLLSAKGSIWNMKADLLPLVLLGLFMDLDSKRAYYRW